MHYCSRMVHKARVVQCCFLLTHCPFYFSKKHKKQQYLTLIKHIIGPTVEL